MKLYDIYSLQLGFHTVAAAGRLVQKWGFGSPLFVMIVMKLYDIYSLQLGFHTVAAAGRLVQK